jgi:hypothetical protein
MADPPVGIAPFCRRAFCPSGPVCGLFFILPCNGPLSLPISSLGLPRNFSPYFGLEILCLSNGPLRFLDVVTLVWAGQRPRPGRQTVNPLHSREVAMRYKIALAALLMAASARAQEPSPLTTGAPAYTLRTPVETLAADPAAAAVLNKDLPGLLSDPNYAIFKTMSLKQMQQASGGDLSIVDVNKTMADLQTLPPR